MMTDLGGLLEGLRRALLNSIAPELHTDFARGQLAAVHDILGKLTRMTVWDPCALQAEADALHEGNKKFVQCLERAGLALTPESDSGFELEAPASRVEGSKTNDLIIAEARTRQLIDWLDAHTGSLSRGIASELHAILQHALREQLRVQRQRIPLTDFSAMTTASIKD